LKKSDIIHIDYDAWIVENNELFDTTRAETAKKNEIFDEKIEYKPQPIIVGAEKVVKGLDSHLLKASVGKKYTVEIEPSDGFGERDPKLIEMHSKREILRLPEFRKGDKEPHIGMKIIMNNRMGWISAITAGRIRVDFNNRFAGHKLKYEYKITAHANKDEEKVKAILEMHYGKIEGFEINLKKDDVAIKLPDACKYDLNWFQTKYRVVSDLRDYGGIAKVQFIEEYVKKVESDKESKEKGAKEKDTKKAKDAKEAEETKETKETKEVIEEKDTKDSPDPKDSKESKTEAKDEKSDK
jgi:FKBP-type peptidyl-prolyl cis-trans isomerase 2